MTSSLLMVLGYSGLGSVQQASLARIWDSRMASASSIYNELTITAIRAYLAADPTDDPGEQLNDLLCSVTSAGDYMAESNQAQEELCVEPTALAKRRFSLNANPSASRSGPNTLPGVGRALSAFANGGARPEYYLYFRYQQTGIGLEGTYTTLSHPSTCSNHP